MPNVKRKSAYLKGKIEQSENGATVKLKINPNTILPIFAILADIAGLTITLVTLFSTNSDTFSLKFGFILIGLGLVYYPVSSLLRNRLWNKLVKQLDLTKL